MKISRRFFFRQAGSLISLAGASFLAPRWSLANHAIPAAGYPLTFPPEFAGGTLEAKPAVREIWPGYPTSVLAVNGSVPGPTIRVQRGEQFKARIQNSLTEALVIHWHGILAPSNMDGNPRDAVAPGGAYDVEFPINQRAGTYWYHAHTDRLTGKQVYQGLAGFFIVEDPGEEALGLPKGVLDVPLLLQDRVSKPDHSLSYAPTMDDMMLGLLGDATTVNGVPNASLSVTRSLYRLRLLNGSNARVFRIGLGDNAPFKLIANDAGLLPAPVEVTSIFLAPGNRAEILVNFADFPHGSTVELKSLGFSGDITVGSTQGQPRTLMRFVGQHVGSGGTVPGTLIPFAPHDPGESKRTRQFMIMMPEGGHGGEPGAMTADHINGLVYEMNRTDFTVPFGEVETWEFHNTAEHMHPMHPHGALLQVISRSTSQTLLPEDSGWKDTVLVRPGEIVRTLIKFEAHQGAFVLHCHNLEHEDGGMMLNFDVAPTIPPVEGPRLQVRREGQQIVVTAPHEATDYRLEGSAAVGPDAVWTTITVPPNHTAIGMEFRLPSEGAAQYFRMVKP